MSKVTKVSNEFDNVRIIKRNLVYAIGIDNKIATKEILMKKEFFGQYGKISKLIVNINRAYNSNNPSNGPSYSAYVTYSEPKEAALAIISLDGTSYNGKLIKSAFGTTKYCSYFIRKVKCPNKDCLYIHSYKDPEDIVTKETDIFYNEQYKLAIIISGIFCEEMKQRLYSLRNDYSCFPNPYSVYYNKSIVAHDPDRRDRKEQQNKKELRKDYSKGSNNGKKRGMKTKTRIVSVSDVVYDDRSETQDRENTDMNISSSKTERLDEEKENTEINQTSENEVISRKSTMTLSLSKDVSKKESSFPEYEETKNKANIDEKEYSHRSKTSNLESINSSRETRDDSLRKTAKNLLYAPRAISRFSFPSEGNEEILTYSREDDECIRQYYMRYAFSKRVKADVSNYERSFYSKILKN